MRGQRMPPVRATMLQRAVTGKHDGRRYLDIDKPTTRRLFILPRRTTTLRLAHFANSRSQRVCRWHSEHHPIRSRLDIHYNYVLTRLVLFKQFIVLTRFFSVAAVASFVSILELRFTAPILFTYSDVSPFNAVPPTVCGPSDGCHTAGADVLHLLTTRTTFDHFLSLAMIYRCVFSPFIILSSRWRYCVPDQRCYSALHHLISQC